MSLVYEKTSTYTAYEAGYCFTIHQSGRQYQVAITAQNMSGEVLDYPPQFGSLGAAKTYCDAWLHAKKRWHGLVIA